MNCLIGGPSNIPAFSFFRANLKKFTSPSRCKAGNCVISLNLRNQGFEDYIFFPSNSDIS